MPDLSPSERARLLSRLASRLAELPVDRTQAWRLGEAVRRTVGADGAVITLEYLTSGRTTLYASDEVAETIESLQEVTGEGPGFEAARTGSIVVAELDEDADRRWPMLTPALVERHGRLRVYAIPVHADGPTGAVATLYTGGGRPLVEAPDGVAFLANAVGTGLLRDAAEHAEPGPEADDGWASRSVVHQATGMVMAQVHVLPDDALALLRAHAYAMSTDVYAVAAQVVARGINFSSFDVEGD